MRILLRLLIASSLAAATPAAAWWEYGHQTIATIAWQEMAPSSRRAAAALMRQERLLDTPDCPARTIEDASVWPDCVKKGDRFSYAETWHYQNIPVCAAFDVKANCPDGQCITAQIPRMVRLLKNRKVPARERLQAFAFLVHFIGDLHQPMHVGDNKDLGGNRTRADYGYKAPPRMNLHRIWDGEMAERAISTPPGNADGLRSEIGAADRADWAKGDVGDWARESWQTSRDLVYGKLPLKRNVCEAKTDERPRLGEDYVAAGVPAMRLAIKRAGVRLAMLLDAAFAPEPLPGSKVERP